MNRRTEPRARDPEGRDSPLAIVITLMISAALGYALYSVLTAACRSC